MTTVDQELKINPSLKGFIDSYNNSMYAEETDSLFNTYSPNLGDAYYKYIKQLHYANFNEEIKHLEYHLCGGKELHDDGYLVFTGDCLKVYVKRVTDTLIRVRYRVTSPNVSFSYQKFFDETSIKHVVEDSEIKALNYAVQTLFSYVVNIDEDTGLLSLNEDANLDDIMNCEVLSLGMLWTNATYAGKALLYYSAKQRTGDMPKPEEFYTFFEQYKKKEFGSGNLRDVAVLVGIIMRYHTRFFHKDVFTKASNYRSSFYAFLKSM